MVYWLAFEYFHLNWDLSWPWLTLGNVFADSHKIIQFYDVTGVLGGSIWVYVVNILAFLILKKKLLYPNKESIKTILSRPVFVAFLLVLIIPVVYSLIRYNSYVEKGEDVEVLVIQPNIDPYTEQYELSPLEAANKMLNLAASKITPETRLIVTPESMIQEYLWETQFDLSPSINRIVSFIIEIFG